MNFVNLRKSTVFAFILLFALTAAFADRVVLDSVSCDEKYGFLSCSYEDGLIDNGYWKPQKKYTWLAGFIDFEKLRAFN